MNSNPLIYSVGTQVVTLKDVYAQNNRVAHPAGAVGVIVQSPVDRLHAYRVKFADSFESPIHHDQLTRLADFKRVQIGSNETPINEALYDRVIYRCVIGSRAYGLEGDESDTDRRGVYLPSAELHWSLYGVPEQLESEETQECYWEIQKFLMSGAEGQSQRAGVSLHADGGKDNAAGQELLAMRSRFCPDSCIRPTTATSRRSSRRCRPTSATRDGEVEARHAPDPIADLGHQGAARTACPRRSG